MNEYEERITALERRNATQADTIRRLSGELAKCERERDELLGCTKEMVTSADGIGQQRDVAAEKERAQCWYLVRRRMAEAMLQLTNDAVEAGPPDPVAVLNDVAVAIAARGLEPAVIGQLDEKARARAHDRAACASRRIPDRFLTGQRYRIDVSVDNGDPVECVAGALWSSMDLAKMLGLGPEDIKRPLLQALAIFGHSVEITTKAGTRCEEERRRNGKA